MCALDILILSRTWPDGRARSREKDLLRSAAAPFPAAARWLGRAGREPVAPSTLLLYAGIPFPSLYFDFVLRF